MMTPRDMNRATLGQSTYRDILVPSVAFRVKYLSVSESRVEAKMQYTLLVR